MAYALTAIDYRVEARKPIIYLFCRDKSRNRKVFKVKDMLPYYYYKDPFGEYPVQGIDGAFVTKKTARTPSDVGRERERHQVTYESDILFPIRFMVDRGIRYGLNVEDGKVVPAEFKGSVIRPLFLDIEVEVTDTNIFPDPRIAKWMILSVTVWCPLDGNVAAWRFEISNEEEEKEFLELFVTLVEEFDPDLITGYNVFFDMCTIIKRMKLHSVPDYNLSPLGRVRIAEHYDRIQIAGRTVFDYYEAYKKYKHRTLPSYKLEDIALDECGFPKSDYPLDKMNRNYVDDVADYNLLDVVRMMVIEEKLEILEFYDDIRVVVGSTFDDVLEASKYVDILLLRYAKGKFLLPRKQKSKKKQDYIGAIVLPPKKGVHFNIAMLDFTKMYPSILISYNISPETLRLTKPEKPHYTLSVGFKYKDEEGNKLVDWRDVYYLKEPQGIAPQIAMDLIKIRDAVRDDMFQHSPDTPEYVQLWHRQDALKVVVDAMYGVFAYPPFRLYVPEISASMTGQGQKIIKRTIKLIEDKGHPVYYGDTDSLYIAVGDNPIEKGEKLRDDVNEFWEKEKVKYGLYIAPSVKLEHVFEWICLAKKKRYAAMAIYDTGKKTHEMLIIGFETRRSDSSPISQRLQRGIFELIDSRASNEEILNFIISEANKVKSEPLRDVGIPLPIRTPIKAMKNVARVKSIVYANEFLNQKIATGSRSLQYYIKTEALDREAKKEFGFKCKPILPDGLPEKFSLRTWSPKEQQYVIKEYIADRIVFNGVPPEEWRPYIDMKTMVEKIVWNKVDTILSALGVSEENRIKLYGSKRPIKKE